jgi:hypothetical protein
MKCSNHFIHFGVVMPGPWEVIIGLITGAARSMWQIALLTPWWAWIVLGIAVILRIYIVRDSRRRRFDVIVSVASCREQIESSATTPSTRIAYDV